MNDQPLVIERIYNAPIAKVWSAITDSAQLKKWYFQIDDFKAEVGFEFSFSASSDDTTYVHLCKVTTVVAGSKIAYTWRYAGMPGITEVIFELFPEGDKTRLRLTHTGIETFAGNGPDFDVSSFKAGWTDILNESLRKYLEPAVV